MANSAYCDTLKFILWRLLGNDVIVAEEKACIVSHTAENM